MGPIPNGNFFQIDKEFPIEWKKIPNFEKKIPKLFWFSFKLWISSDLN